MTIKFVLHFMFVIAMMEHSWASPVLPDALLGRAPALKGQAVSYLADDAQTRGYLAKPQNRPINGGVLLIHEWDGLTLRVKEIADAFAKVGYAALAVDLYRGNIGKSRSENLALVRAARANPKAITQNLNAALSTLREDLDIKGGIATIGWCFGGGIALSFALEGEKHEGTAIFYGSLLDDPERLKHIHHEVYGTFAGLDRGPSRDDVDRFVSALRSAGVPNDVHVYDNVQHGFWLHADRDPQTNTAPAQDAWSRLLKYLERTSDQPRLSSGLR